MPYSAADSKGMLCGISVDWILTQAKEGESVRNAIIKELASTRAYNAWASTYKEKYHKDFEVRFK
ncbi:hypothetical protein [Solitalea lacus]|uniref:hypothetical protein n=1 Tax=Solitalea lacus TaxID=2911172 RepID=UPI001EDA8A5A|nr:hypothetical protein [Solitalea lacus]UKJ07823.1 hypothetical protein L2B55_01345 [Solitalea lacus]